MATKHSDIPMVRAPEDFHRVGSVANAGWFNMKKVGNVIQGTLEGMFVRKDTLNPKGESNFFQVQITADCEVRMGHAEDARIVTAKAGDYVNLNWGPKTKQLEDVIPDLMHGAKYEVWGAVIGEKVKLTGGRTMHNFDLFTKMVRAPKSMEASEPDFTGGEDLEGPAGE